MDGLIDGLVGRLRGSCKCWGKFLSCCSDSCQNKKNLPLNGESMDGLLDSLMDGLMILSDGWSDGWTNGWTDGWSDGLTDGWSDG